MTDHIKFKIVLLSICFALGINYSQAQDNKPDWSKLHYLSEEEMHLEFDFKRNFNETDPPEGPVRNVAEYDQMQSVLIRYPFGIPMTLIKEMADDCEVVTLVANSSQQESVITQYTNNDVNLDNCSFLIAPTDSYWTRDYGPWFVFDGDNKPGIVDFPYNRPRPNDNNVPSQVASYLNIDLYGMILETAGGNYMTDGLGRSSSTELIYEENPQLSVHDVDSIVEYFLGIEDYYVIDDPLDDYIKHIDCWGKFLSPGKVLIGEVPESDYRYDDFEAAADFFKNEISAWGKPYEVFRVYTPGGNPSTPFTNSLILNEHVFVPITGSQWDDEALEAYEIAMPGYVIHPIYHNTWQNTDALHCRTKGIADLGMLYIEHMPLLGTVGHEDSYELIADITTASGGNIYTDSVLIYYNINGGDYMLANMQFDGGQSWSGAIDGVSAGDDVDYYIYAADESGRRAKHPYIGQPDPHEFHAMGFVTTELGLSPDTLLFLSYDDCLDGKILNVVNIASDSVEILEITPDSYAGGFPWMVEEMPVLPFKLGPSDTLFLNVVIGLITNAGEDFLQDTIFVTTAENEYSSLIVVDADLIQAQNEIAHRIQTKVYPNPFQSKLSIELDLKSAQKLTIKLYDLSGKLVYENKGDYKTGKQIFSIDAAPLDLHPGTYIFQIIADGKTQSGKVVYKP